MSAGPDLGAVFDGHGGAEFDLKDVRATSRTTRSRIQSRTISTDRVIDELVLESTLTAH